MQDMGLSYNDEVDLFVVDLFVMEVFMEFTGDFEPMKMIERAVRNAKPKINGRAPRWVAVMDTFGYGSTTSRKICRHFGLNPDEEVSGVRCIACNP